MPIQLGSAYGKIILDASGVRKGVQEAVKSMDGLKTASKGAISQEFVSRLNTTTISTKDFGAQLMQAGQEAGLTSNEMFKMANATGLYSDKELLAARASAMGAQKAQELTAAVANGTMTTREAGKAFAEFARENEIAANKTLTLKGALDSINATVKGVGLIAGSVGVVLKKTFDLGEEGAAVLQTRESFKTLLEEVGAAPDLLNQLRDASRGTVSDMKLMSSTAILLAGVEDDLAQSFTDALPRIMDIAKAANKLNPTLGDTTFLFDSLARGIKRNSPLIIDNTGLVVKVEEAYQKLAKQLGKNADELTAVEQKQALLNAVLEAGDKLIAQVGGTTESQTDSFQRMDAAVQNAADAVKSKFAPVIAASAEGLALFLTYSERVNALLADAGKNALAAGTGYREYARAQLDAAELAGGSSALYAKVAKQHMDSAMIVDELTQKYGSLNMETAIHKVAAGEMLYADFKLYEANYKNAEIYGKATDQLGMYSIALYRGNLAAQEWINTHKDTGPLDKWEGFIKRSAEATDENTSSAEMGIVVNKGLALAIQQAVNAALPQIQALKDEQLELAAVQAGVQAQLGGVAETQTEVLADLGVEQEKIVAQLADMKNKGKENTEEFKDLTAELENNKAKQLEAKDAIAEAAAMMIYQKVAAGLDAAAQLDLAKAMGILSETDYNMIKTIDQVTKHFDANGDGSVSAAEGADQYMQALEAIHQAASDGNFTLEEQEDILSRLNGKRFISTYEIRMEFPGGGRPETGWDGPAILDPWRQGGGISLEAAGTTNFVIPPGFPADSFTMGLTSGERVTVDRPGSPAARGGGDTIIIQQHNYNPAAAAISNAEIRRMRRGRFDRRMGVG